MDVVADAVAGLPCIGQRDRCGDAERAGDALERLLHTHRLCEQRRRQPLATRPNNAGHAKAPPTPKRTMPVIHGATWRSAPSAKAMLHAPAIVSTPAMTNMSPSPKRSASRPAIGDITTIDAGVAMNNRPACIVSYSHTKLRN